MAKVPNYVVNTSGSSKITPKPINIDGSEDPFYRYKMRQLYVQVVGKGKMIKTVLLNIDDVAKDLKVPPSYLTAYFGYEIGAKTAYDAKKPDRERASVSGSYQGSQLSEIMKKFIQDLVLCPKCKLPEITMRVDKKAESINTSCRGCGESSILTSLRPKMKHYILNHSSDIVTNKEEKAVKKKQDEVTKDSTSNGTSESNGDVASEKKVQKSKKTKKPTDDEDDIEWSVDTSAEAMKQRRMQLLPENVRQLVAGQNEKEASDPISELRQFLEKDRSTDAIVTEVNRIQNDYGFSNKKRSALLFEVLFEENKIPTISKNQDLLSKFLEDDEESQFGILDCIEKLCADKDATALVGKAAVIVKQFYDSDLLSEEVIIDWFENKLKTSRIKEEIQPLIQWLEEAEEESEEE